MNAVITGATKGIGKAIAYKLASEGYNLVICSRNQLEINTLLADLKTINPTLYIAGLEADCANPEQLTRFADFVLQHLTFVDVLVNNAGLYIPSKILDEPDDALDVQMKLNVYAPHFLCKIFGKKMRDMRRGHIINICSVAGIKPVVNAGSYSVTKYAMIGLTKVLREELMPYQVKVTAIIPGSTLTESWDSASNPDRFVKPSDVASAVFNCLQMSVGCNIDELVIRPVEGEI